ncbi:DUF692 domain-containing protein [Sandaracinobacter neustonicus]|uniref:UPF0276 protein FJQ54_15285 n=1 Tax=Sandaracinobacter neustonicus TaxID=1715348 RepID=A0A501XD01_9SPHN|nr:DUF692 domain-containing protein [Sandaracinobacter neustonicus]TPE58441.1 DUF692 domain-containing protein [Sandaracinobacter neustonicus]
MQPLIPPFTGFGLGLRREHYAAFLDAPMPDVDFVEIISENFMVEGGRPLVVLDAVRRTLPVAMHGVSLNIGSASGLDRDYLARLRALADRLDPLWVSDHLCWTGVDGGNSHDLLPLPLTAQALEIVCENIHQAQDALGRPMLFENPSSYVQFPGDEMPEWAFLSEICSRTGCCLLLDINNVFVSCTNHGLDPRAWLAGIPADRVRQVHLAGHSQGSDMLIDTHDAPVADPVWALLAETLPRLGPVAVMIERDDHIPPLPEILAELAIARAIAAGAGGLARCA